jgi:hypothetical protein
LFLDSPFTPNSDFEDSNAVLTPQKNLTFQGEILEQEDISAIAQLGDQLIIGADEGHAVQVLTVVDGTKAQYVISQSLRLMATDQDEIDIEDICCQGEICYVIGSHSIKRKKVDPEKSYKVNRERIAEVKIEKTRGHLFRLVSDPKIGALVEQGCISLQSILTTDEILGRFASIPSKENGLDIEGLAMKGDRLYIGFRSPVLRENYVPVLITEFDQPKDYELVFINLGGRGVRAMADTNDGFLIIGGPPGDGEGTFHLYFWTGEDMIPGNDRSAQRILTDLGEIQLPIAAAKAEGLTVIEESSRAWEVVIVYDGITGGNPQRFRVEKTEVR